MDLCVQIYRIHHDGVRFFLNSQSLGYLTQLGSG
jgi:hypothetical protein